MPQNGVTVDIPGSADARDRARGDLATRLEESARRARSYFESARAPATLQAYKSDLTDFETWAEVDAGGRSTLPASPETVAMYIGDLAGRGLKASTINRRLTAISVMHQSSQLESPTDDQRVKDVLKGIRREHGSYQKGAAPLLTSTLRRMILAMPEKTEQEKAVAARDATLLLVGYAGAFRRSELASLRLEDIEFTEDGAVILLRRSKTDQEGRGLRKALPYGSCTFPSSNRTEKADAPTSAGRNTPMGSIHEVETEREEFIFDLDEIARQGARRMLAEALEAEVEAYIEAAKDGRDEEGRALVVRNGHANEREILLGAGSVAVKAPRVNDKRVDDNGERRSFKSVVLPPYMRKSPKVSEVLPLLYLHGLSSGDFIPALEGFFGSGAGLSAKSVQRLTEA